jgi:hypothetical protein
MSPRNRWAGHAGRARDHRALGLHDHLFPQALRLARAAARALRAPRSLPRGGTGEAAPARDYDFILFGLGRYGWEIGEKLKARGYSVLGVDFDPEALRLWRTAGHDGCFGDATDPEFPSHLPLARAHAVISAVPRTSGLVANRSEIAIRVLRAANELGMRTVAVYAEEDKLALHRFKADEAYRSARRTWGRSKAYLSIEEIIRVAREAKAPTPSIRATACCPRTPTSPRPAPRKASCSSARAERPCASSATRSRRATWRRGLGRAGDAGDRAAARRHRCRGRGWPKGSAIR